jgi:hypothetical protein
LLARSFDISESTAMAINTLWFFAGRRDRGKSHKVDLGKAQQSRDQVIVALS